MQKGAKPAHVVYCHTQLLYIDSLVSYYMYVNVCGSAPNVFYKEKYPRLQYAIRFCMFRCKRAPKSRFAGIWYVESVNDGSCIKMMRMCACLHDTKHK